MAFCAAHGIDNAFGLPTNAVLHTYVETRYHARS